MNLPCESLHLSQEPTFKFFNVNVHVFAFFFPCKKWCVNKRVNMCTSPLEIDTLVRFKYQMKQKWFECDSILLLIPLCFCFFFFSIFIFISSFLLHTPAATTKQNIFIFLHRNLMKKLGSKQQEWEGKKWKRQKRSRRRREKGAQRYTPTSTTVYIAANRGI